MSFLLNEGHINWRLISRRLFIFLFFGMLILYGIWPWLPGKEKPTRTLVLFGFSILSEVINEGIFPEFQKEWESKTEKERVERHLQLRKASLTAMGISNFIKIIENPSPVDGIISELDSGNYHLLVIGAPAPTSAQSFFRPNLTSQIINRSTKPVLVVPMLHD